MEWSFSFSGRVDTHDDFRKEERNGAIVDVPYNVLGFKDEADAYRESFNKQTEKNGIAFDFDDFDRAVELALVLAEDEGASEVAFHAHGQTDLEENHPYTFDFSFKVTKRTA